MSRSYTYDGEHPAQNEHFGIYGIFKGKKCVVVVKKDFIKEYTDACRDAGLKTGIYYSPLDWRFPGYFIPGLFAKNAKQLCDQAHSQVRELLTNYGKIDIIWFDGGEDYYL